MLHIESSGPLCSVALSDGLELIDYRSATEEKQHIGQLAVILHGLLEDHSLGMTDITLISLSAGPGSYTGLRVAYALVKGLVWGLTTYVVTIPTHESLLYAVDTVDIAQGYQVVLHVRKNEYIIYRYNKQHQLVEQLDTIYENLGAQISNQDSMGISDRIIEGIDVVVCKRSAVSLIHPAYNRFVQGRYDDVRQISPIYYKPPYITQRKRKLI